MSIGPPADRKSPHTNPDGERGIGASWWFDRICDFASLMVFILAITTVGGLLARSHWLADLFANLRVQQVIGLLCIVPFTLFGRRWRWLALTLILLGIHLPWFSSAWAGDSAVRGRVAVPKSSTKLRVLVANVLTSNGDHDVVIQQVNESQTDIFAILELSSAMHRSLELEFEHAYPYRIASPQDQGNFGIGVYSRWPLTDAKRFSLNIPSIVSIAVTVDKAGHHFRVVATHPLPPMGDNGFRNRNEHLRQLSDLIVAGREQQPRLPVIVMGDLNLTPWSPWFSDWESSTGLSRAGRGHGVTPTWYAKPIFPMGLMLDHVLISDELTCVSHQTGAAMGSDHRAVIVDLENH